MYIHVHVHIAADVCHCMKLLSHVSMQDLTHKLCEVLSIAAGCFPLSSTPLPPPLPPPPPASPPLEPSSGPEGFEVVETSDLHTTERKHHVSEIFYAS